MIEEVIRFKRSSNNTVAPQRAHPHDAGWDVCADESLVLYPQARRDVRTGLTLQIPAGWMVEIRPRSGLALSTGVTVLNTPGTIDAGYQGEVVIVLVNHGDHELGILRGMRIAQLVPQRVPEVAFEEAREDEVPTERGEGGLGSTGV